MQAKRIAPFLAVLLLALAPAAARADTIDVQLTQLETGAQQWWAGYGLTTSQGYAAGGYAWAPGCGDTVTILREHVAEGELSHVQYPHGCDIHISEELVRAAFAPYSTPRSAFMNYAITRAGLSPRGRYAARALLCAVMFHETGHILGLPHAPTGIMQNRTPAPPSACVAWARG